MPLAAKLQILIGDGVDRYSTLAQGDTVTTTVVTKIDVEGQVVFIEKPVKVTLVEYVDF